MKAKFINEKMASVLKPKEFPFEDFKRFFEFYDIASAKYNMQGFDNIVPGEKYKHIGRSDYNSSNLVFGFVEGDFVFQVMGYANETPVLRVYKKESYMYPKKFYLDSLTELEDIVDLFPVHPTVYEDLAGVLKPKTEEEIYLDAKKRGKLSSLQGWYVYLDYSKQGIRDYLQDWTNFEWEDIKMTRDINKAFHFKTYDRAHFLAAMLGHKYHNIDLAKVTKSGISDKLQENMGDSSKFLKPKSEDDVIEAFKKLEISQQIEFLEREAEDGYNDYDQEEPEFHPATPDSKKTIPKKYWPLIVTIKEEMKNDKKFDSHFRITSAEQMGYYHINIDTPAVGMYFRVYSRNYPNLPFIFVEQLNREKDNIRAYIKTEENQKGKMSKIKTYKEFWDWMMKVGYKTYINEGISNILKPKSTEDLLKSFKELSISSQAEWILDNVLYTKDSVISIEHWPLILQIKERLKHNSEFTNRYEMTSISNRDPFTDGEIQFKIYSKTPTALSNHIQVSQYDSEPHNIHVYDIDKYDTTLGLAATPKEEIIEDYRGFIKWLNDDYLYKWGLIPIAESIKDVLKPKDISKIDDLKPTELFKAKWKHMDIDISKLKKPLIFDLDDKAEKYWRDCGDFDTFDAKGNPPWRNSYDNKPVGVHFFINSPNHEFEVAQYDREKFARVYSKISDDIPMKKVRSFKELKNYVENFKVTNESIIDNWEEEQEAMPEREYKEAVQRIVSTYTRNGSYNFSTEAIKYYVITEIKKGRDPADLTWVGYENSIHGKRG